jgi:hypothetical protein
MRPIFCLLVVLIVLASCSGDNNTGPENFFNLETGNLWVYKRFNSPDNITYTASTRIDSVSVIGTVVFEGDTYSRMLHKIYNAGIFSEQFEQNLRVDENGHLVFPSGLVLNPGTDTEFTDVRPFQDAGNITYQLDDPIDVTVEGQEYFVYPYVGDYVPFNDQQPGQVIYDQYQSGLGLVCQHCTNPQGTSFYEDRLISFELN